MPKTLFMKSPKLHKAPRTGSKTTAKPLTAKTIAKLFTAKNMARALPLNLDLPGILFVEAAARIQRGEKQISGLRRALKRHRKRLTWAQQAKSEDEVEDKWVDVIQGVGGLEPIFGATVREFAVADVLLVAAAEAYINSVAVHVLVRSEFEQFDKLSPVGKWLFLPKVMKLKWQLSLDKGCLQQFAAVVTRRNRVVHPRVIRVKSVSEVEAFLKQFSLDPHQAQKGLTAVADLIRGISFSWKGSYGPNWLEPAGASERPPCFFLGSVEASLRLGEPGEA